MLLFSQLLKRRTSHEKHDHQHLYIHNFMCKMLMGDCLYVYKEVSLSNEAFFIRKGYKS